MSRPDAAVAIVHTRSTPESVLLMRRSERPDDSWSGHWSLPGGRCDVADTSLVDTALRELEEECGIRLTENDLESALPHTVARRKAGPFLTVAPFVFRVEGEMPTTLDVREAVESLWIPLDHLRDPARHSLRVVPGRPREMLFPAIALNGTPLWGFTYRLLGDWLHPEDEPKPDGLEVAGMVLDFLLSMGLEVRSAWNAARAAEITGPIPVDALLARFSGTHVVGLNTLEVHPHLVRILGPEWEEYRIATVER